MFSKAVALLVFAACAIAGPRAGGTYFQITNVASQTTARVDSAGGLIYVSSDNHDPGPFQMWDIKGAKDNGDTIDNVGVHTIQRLDSFAAVLAAEDGAPVITNRDATIFNIEPAGTDKYVIKLQNDDLLWNIEPKGGVKLRPAHGGATQLWTLTDVQY